MTTRNRFKTILTLAAMAMAILVLTATLANAKLVLEEQFIYEPSQANIDGQNGGTGFDGPWVSNISHGRIYWIHSPGLSFSTLPVAGNALSRYGTMGRAEAHRLLSAESQTSLTRDDTTIWFSVLYQEPDSGYKHGSFLFGTYKFSTQGTPMLGDGDTDRNPPFTPVNGDGFGFTLQAAPDGSTQGTGTINALAFDNSSTPIVVQGTFTPNPMTATVLIAGKINWKPNGTPDELFLFNVTDLLNEPPESAAIASITNLDSDQSAFDTVTMWDSSFSINDEIRFGNTFANVMGIPDPNLPSVDAGVDMITWSGQKVQLAPTVVNNDTEFPQRTLGYLWSAEPVDGVVFSDNTAEVPTVTITKDTDNSSAVMLTFAVTLEGEEPVEDTMTIDVYDDSCLAAKAVGAVEFDPTDLDENCITNLADFAELATTWLVDYILTAPVPK